MKRLLLWPLAAAAWLVMMIVFTLVEALFRLAGKGQAE